MYVDKETAPLDERLVGRYEALIQDLRACKPDDRSERDRNYAIAITKMQEAYAWFSTYCRKLEK